MAVGNTIGRIVGQSPASKGSPQESNPAVKLPQSLQQLVQMGQQLSGMVQQLAGGGSGGAGGAGGASPLAALGGAGGLLKSAGDLQGQLTQLGALVQTTPGEMEGAPSSGQQKASQLTQEILKQAMAVSKPPGSPVHAPSLDKASESITALANGASSPAQAVQSLGNATTLAQGKGASPPVLQMLQSLLGKFQQTLQQAQGLKGGTNGAQILKG